MLRKIETKDQKLQKQPLSGRNIFVGTDGFGAETSSSDVGSSVFMGFVDSTKIQNNTSRIL